METTAAGNDVNLGNIILNGGTLTAAGSGASSSYNSICLLGNVYVTGTGTSTINGSGAVQIMASCSSPTPSSMSLRALTLNVSDYLSTAVVPRLGAALR